METGGVAALPACLLCATMPEIGKQRADHIFPEAHETALPVSRSCTSLPRSAPSLTPVWGPILPLVQSRCCSRLSHIQLWPHSSLQGGWEGIRLTRRAHVLMSACIHLFSQQPTHTEHPPHARHCLRPQDAAGSNAKPPLPWS